jgi:hypothetical protein
MRLDFDASKVVPKRESEALPAGRYTVTITESEQVPTRAGDGSFLKLTFRVEQGPYARRLLWTRLNLENPNPRAVEIAQGELSAICHAVGVLRPGDATDLHGIPLVVRVTQVPRRDTGEMSNEIKGYEAAQDQPAPGPRQSQPTTPGYRPSYGPKGAVRPPAAPAWSRKPNPPTDQAPPPDMPF